MISISAIDHMQYLERINYRGEINPSIAMLTTLQQLHLLSVPFENLDIHLGKKIDLANSYDKIVNKRRGGFCYELNGLFFQLLQTIGFEVKLISARVYNKDNYYGPEFDHMAIIAAMQETKYLVDVGFGEFAYSPLKIAMDIGQADRTGNFTFKLHDHDYLCVGKMEDDSFLPAYIFREMPRQLDDFLEMCNFHQTSSLSHFTQKRLCSMVTEKGRVTLTGNKLKKNENGAISETELKDDEEFNQALWDYFKIKL